MPRNSRSHIDSSFLHIMVQGLNKEYIFNNDADKREYQKFMDKIRKNIDITIISYCIMDNHVHILVKIDNQEQISNFMHKVNTLYGIYYNQKYNRVGYVFRDRYKSQTIYSEKQLYTCINYIHNNPVKAEICKTPEQYEYSSFNEYNKRVSKDISKTLNKNFDFKQENIIFLEDEDEREKQIYNFIKEYLASNKLNLDKLKENKVYLNEIANLLKDNYGLSLRKIATYLDVGRETVRRVTK